MTQDQDNVTTMFETTNSVLAENVTLWSGIPAFANAVERVTTGTTVIREKEGEQLPTGDTDAKQAVRDDLEEKTLLIADQLSALAAKTANPMLAAKVNYDKSQLDRMAASDLLTAAKAVRDAAAEHHAVLASDYLITAADLTAQATAVTSFDGVKTAPRNAVIAKKVATLSLPDAITLVRGIYRNELDKMVTRFKKTQPAFYAAYTAARITVDRTATREVKPAANPSGTPAAPK